MMAVSLPLLIFVWVLLLVSTLVASSQSCLDGWKMNPTGGCYRVFTSTKEFGLNEKVSMPTLGECTLGCAMQNSSILCISSAEENDFYGAVIKKEEKIHAWLGLYDETGDRRTRWSKPVPTWASGCTSRFTSWQNDEPTSHLYACSGDAEKCAVMNPSGWEDVPCTSMFMCICEMESNTSNSSSSSAYLNAKKSLEEPSCNLPPEIVMVSASLLLGALPAFIFASYRRRNEGCCHFLYSRKLAEIETTVAAVKKKNGGGIIILVKIPNGAVEGEPFDVPTPKFCCCKICHVCFHGIDGPKPKRLYPQGRDFEMPTGKEKDTLQSTGVNHFTPTGQPLKIVCPQGASEGDIVEIQAPACTLAHVDMQAHNGLRGILALHVALFHCIYYSELRVNIQGSASMPWFFLLSGFSLAVRYGGEQIVQKKAFYQNRFARVMPMFWLMQLYAMPLVLLGHSWVPPPTADMLGPTQDNMNGIDLTGWAFAVGVFNSIFATGAWTANPLSFCGPSWTISTLVALYLMFPSLLKRLQYVKSKVDATERTIIVGNWHFGMFFLGVGVLMSPLISSFWFATAWPFAMPLHLFSAGILCGLQCITSPPGSYIDPDGKGDTTKAWAWRTDVTGALITFTQGICSIMSFMGYEVWGQVWGQLMLPYHMCIHIVGLTRDGKQSVFGRICRSSLFQFLGRISLALYLVHEPMIQYLCAWYYGPLVYADTDTGTTESAHFSRVRNRMPSWGIPIVMTLSLISAVLLERFFERPLRSCLRAKKRTRMVLPLDEVEPKNDSFDEVKI